MKKKTDKKPLTKKAIKAALSASGYLKTKLTKVVPPLTTEAPAGYAKKQKAAKRRAVERKKLALPIPEKYKKAVRSYGIAKTENIEKRRGRYYTAAGVYNVNRFGLEIKHKSKAGKVIEPQNVYAWENSSRKGWYTVIKNGIVQPKLKRWKDVSREQNKAWRDEKITVTAAKTGKTKADIKKIISTIRKEEAGKLRRFKKSAAYKKLSKSAKKKNKISNRVNAIFGAMTDILEVHGSPKPLKDGQEREWRKTSSGKWQYKNGGEAWAPLERPKKKEKRK